MAKVTLTFCTAGNRSLEGGTLPVPRLPNGLGEVIETTSTSAASQIASSDPQGTGFVSVTAEGGGVWIVAGAAPVAVPPSGAPVPGFLVLDGQTRDFGVNRGDRVAVVSL